MKRFFCCLLLLCLGGIVFPALVSAGAQGESRFFQQAETLPDRQDAAPAALAEIPHAAVAACGSSQGQARIPHAVMTGRHQVPCPDGPEILTTCHARSSFYALADIPFGSDISPPLSQI